MKEARFSEISLLGASFGVLLLGLLRNDLFFVFAAGFFLLAQIAGGPFRKGVSTGLEKFGNFLAVLALFGIFYFVLVPVALLRRLFGKGNGAGSGKRKGWNALNSRKFSPADFREAW